MFDFVRWLHLLAATVWVGGLITLGALVPAARRAGADRTMLQAMARQFGRVSWTAMVLAIVTGVVELLDIDLSGGINSDYGRTLFVKLLLVGIAIALALGHQLTARTTSPAVRGIIQALILLTSLGILAAAVALGAA
jgi:putative copper export protein